MKGEKIERARDLLSKMPISRYRPDRRGPRAPVPPGARARPPIEEAEYRRQHPLAYGSRKKVGKRG